ncbi:MAG: tRNA (adenosine(37)-N6)-threonylcarbamoyltransferase complex dimerization subunit type 1 TsaB [Patescibacteria group bacterium]
MILILNTSGPETEVLLVKGNDLELKKIKGEKRQAENLLNGVDLILKENKADLAKIKGIGVVTGPGSFTSLRIGVTAANVLAYALKIPAVGISLKEFKDNKDLVGKILKKLAGKKFGLVLPFYGKEPNIIKKE